MEEVYKPLTIFIVTSLISFVGSLQLGPVNLTVIQSVLRRNLSAGLWVALGGCLPEMIYASAAVWAGMWLEEHQQVWKVLEWVAVPLLLGIGIATFFASKQSSAIKKPRNNSFSLAKGFTIGLLNPQLFPYWLVMLVQFGSYDSLRVQTLWERLAFVIGTSVGAFGLLVAVAYLALRFREKLLQRMEKWDLNRFLGVLFMLLALGQLLKLWLRS